MSTRGPANAQDSGPLVVCCAAVEAGAIRTALAELEGLGHTLEIVDGVEHAPKKLAAVIERLHGDGLYVLCRSKLLGRDTVEQLREILLTHHVPFGRTVTVATRQPRELVERIKASVARAGTRRAVQPKSEREPFASGSGAPSSKSRPGAASTPTAIARSRAAKAPSTGRRDDDDLDDAITGAQPVLNANRATHVGPAPTDEGTDPRASLNEHTSGGAELPSEFDPPTLELPREQLRKARQGDMDLAAISLTDAAVEIDDDEPDPMHDVDSSLAGASLASIDFSDLERVDSGRIALSPKVPVRSGDTSVAPAPSPPPSPPPLPAPPMPAATPPPTPAPMPPRAPGAPPKAATSTMPVAPVPLASASSARTSDLSSLSAPAGAVASTSLETEASSGRFRLVWGAGLLVVAVLAVGVAWTMKGGDGREPDKTAASTVESADDTSKKAEGREPEDTPGTTEGDDESADLEIEETPEPPPPPVAAALKERRVRALDILLVQPESAGPMSHDDARVYCDDLDVVGIRGWRLPEVGELSSLTEAGMVGGAVYWSHTAGDTFGDTHLAWHGRRRRVLQQSNDSRVLCVHGNRVLQ